MYLGWIECPDAVEQHIMEKHSVTVGEVRAAFQHPARLTRSRWTEDRERGSRLVVFGSTYSQRPLEGYLYPVDLDEGTWRLGSALDA